MPRRIEGFPVRGAEPQKEASDLFPQVFQPACLLPGRPGQRAAALLGRVHEEYEHHQGGQYVGQVRAVVAEVVRQVVARQIQMGMLVSNIIDQPFLSRSLAVVFR